VRIGDDRKIAARKIDGALSAAVSTLALWSRFNSFITERLLAAAVDALERAGRAPKM